MQCDRWLICFALLAPFLSAALMIQSIAAMMGQPVWITEWATIEAMIATTSMGWAFAVRLALLSGALIALLLKHRLAAGPFIAAVLYGMAVASLAWSGHAAALAGDIGLFHRVNDAVHMLAAGLWLGAIGWFLHLTIRTHRYPGVTLAQPLLNAMHGFAPVGMALVAIVAITGLVNAQMIFGLQNSGTVLMTSYGQLLATKVAIVALMLLCGGRNALIGKRRADALSTGLDTDSTASLAALRVSLSTEIVLAIAVIGLVAIVGLMSPMS